MRILMIVPLFYPAMGGAETVVLEQSKELVSKGCSVTVLTSKISRTHSEEYHEGIKIIRPSRAFENIMYGMLFHLSTIISFIVYFIKTNNRRYDIIHSHMVHYPVIIGILFKWINPNTKLIVTAHGSDLNIYTKSILAATIARLLLSKANHLIVVSSDLAKKALELGVQYSKIVRIPNGVSSEFFLIENTPIKKFDILFFGGIKWQKGIEYLLRAIAILNEQNVIVKVAIAGSGPDLERLVKIRNSLNLSNVLFLGHVDTDEIKNLLSISRIVVFPSLTEGMPCALLEAMAAGKPIIATNVGGNSEVLKGIENVTLVSPKDSTSLAYAILNLANNKANHESIGKNLRKIAEQYKWSLITSRLYDIYKVNRN